MKKISYARMIELVESFTTTGVFVAVIYHSGKHEWLPVDKHLYLQDLKGVLNPECYDFPCYTFTLGEKTNEC